jgi:hypothetical protein
VEWRGAKERGER